MPPRPQLDRTDYEIIRALHEDARISASDIARRLDANERTIRKRIDRLTALGVIRLTAIVNPSAFGYVVAVDIFLEADPDLEDEILRSLTAMEQVTYIAFGQGSRDLSIEARFKDNDGVREFLRRTLPSIPGLKVNGYTLVPRILRNIDEWMPGKEDFGIESHSNQEEK